MRILLIRKYKIPLKRNAQLATSNSGKFSAFVKLLGKM
jgi:hypothetical protein